MTRLSVNLNKVALLRNSRTLGIPAVTEFGAIALDAGARQLTGRITLDVEGRPVAKRFVVRWPAAGRWNGALVIGAHGGSGGDDYDRALAEEFGVTLVHGGSLLGMRAGIRIRQRLPPPGGG